MPTPERDPPPLQGDLPDSLLRLPRLRSLTLQRHPLAPAVGSRVLRRLQVGARPGWVALRKHTARGLITVWG